MTKTEYKEYQKQVEDFFEGECINNLSYDPDGGANFSTNTCECCGSQMAGDRYIAIAYSQMTQEVQEYEVCADCLHYAEYGHLDDMTMMDMD